MAKLRRIWSARWEKIKDHMTEWGLVAWLTLWTALGAYTTTLYPEQKLVIDAPDWLVSIIPAWAWPYVPFLAAAIWWRIKQRKAPGHAGRTKNLGRMMSTAFAAGMGPVASASHLILIV